MRNRHLLTVALITLNLVSGSAKAAPATTFEEIAFSALHEADEQDRQAVERLRTSGMLSKIISTLRDEIRKEIRTSEKASETSRASAMNVEGVCIAETTLNVRSSPSTSASVIGSLHPEEAVWLISERNAEGRAWYEVSWKGKRGWVAADYITIPEWNE